MHFSWIFYYLNPSVNALFFFVHRVAESSLVVHRISESLAVVSDHGTVGRLKCINIFWETSGKYFFLVFARVLDEIYGKKQAVIFTEANSTKIL